MKKGDKVEGHAHKFDHATLVVAGAILIEQLEVIVSDKNGRPLQSKVVRSAEVRAGLAGEILILKGTWHKLTALEDGTIYKCIYSHRTPDGAIVDYYDGWPNAYE